MLDAFIVRDILIICKGADLFLLRFLQIFDRCLDLPQQHFRYIAGGGSQTGNGIQGVEIDNTVKIL